MSDPNAEPADAGTDPPLEEHGAPAFDRTKGLRQSWSRLRPVVRPLWRKVILLAVVSTGAGFAEALTLVAIVHIALTLSGAQTAASFSLGPLGIKELTVPVLFAVALGAGVFRFVFQLCASYIGPRMATSALQQLREEGFRAYLTSSWSTQTEDKEGQLQDLMTVNAGKACMAVMAFGLAVTMFFNFAALFSSTIVINPIAAGSIMIAIGTLFMILRPLGRRSKRLAARESIANLGYATSVTESARLMQEIRVFGVGGEVEDIIRSSSRRSAQAYFRQLFAARLVPAVYQGAALVFVIICLAALYSVKTANLESLGAVVLVLLRALSYSQSFQQYVHETNDLIPYIERHQETVKRYLDSSAPTGNEPLDRTDRIEFLGVGYSYEPGVPVLSDVSFRVERGEAIGIIGPSGTGKSTLIQILLRLRNPTTGNYLINGLPASEYQETDWFRKVAFVPQDPQVASASIADNIAFFRDDISREDIRRAAELAHLDHDIEAWAEGYDRMIGQRDSALSGGQRQRLCLARALVGHPELLVLDEPTSALDMQSEALVHETLEALKGTTTIFVIAHRLSTLNVCDRIMVLDHGHIQGFEPPGTLLASNSFYRDAVALSQLR